MARAVLLNEQPLLDALLCIALARAGAAARLGHAPCLPAPPRQHVCTRGPLWRAEFQLLPIYYTRGGVFGFPRGASSPRGSGPEERKCLQVAGVNNNERVSFCVLYTH